MRVIAFINQKGGVGKTTSAVHFAAALARTNRSVLLIDLDPQSHASLHLGLQAADDEPTIYDVLAHNAPLAGAARYADERLAVAPSNIHLVGAELELSALERREARLSDALRPHAENFEFAVIDCSPSLGLLTVNALTAAGEVVIPLQPHFLALQGLGRLLDTVSLVREHHNPALRVAGVLMCMFDRGTRLAQEVVEDVRGFLAAAQPHQPWHGARVFDATIRRNIKLAECPSFGKSVFEYAPSSHAAEDYLAFCQEYLRTVGSDVVAERSAPAAELAGDGSETASLDPVPPLQTAGHDPHQLRGVQHPYAGARRAAAGD